jgi:prevent-host-death family protein
MHQVDIDEAQAHLPDLVQAAMSGVEVIITKDDRPVAKLLPLAQTKPRPQFGSAAGLITMSDDFDAPLEDFNDYVR